MQFFCKIWDWKRQWFQVLILFLIVFIDWRFNVPDFLKSIVTKSGVPIEALDPKWRIVLGGGIIIFTAFVFIGVYIGFRNANERTEIRQSILRSTVWHSYVGYWFCRYILGYKKISLIRVPIPKQFQIVCYNLFDVDKDELKDIATKDEDVVRVSYYNDSLFTSEIVLILSDTYSLDRDKVDIDSLKNLTTIVVDRSSDDHTRYYSPKFISTINNEVHRLPNSVETIHLFATMNPSNCYHVASDIFMTGGRDSWKHLYVYEQNKDTWKFDRKKRVKAF